jgi:Putative prokaryotic signal transducing protein
VVTLEVPAGREVPPVDTVGTVQGLRMVPVLRAEGTFHARVVAARLGSEGIVTQLRGNVDGPYPMGAVEVMVTEDDLEAARELLLADEVESSFDLEDEAETPAARRTPSYGPWLLAAFAGVVLLGALLSPFLR